MSVSPSATFAHTLRLSAMSLFLACALPAAAKQPAAVATNTAASSSPAALIANPAAEEQASLIELVFVLDTTGSMGGLLEGAKTKIWGIVNEIMQKRSSKPVKVKVGLVAYRDKGDAYLTKVTPLTENLDDVYAELMSFRAQGGGDMPEDVRTALHEGLNKVGWSNPGARTSQILFLVGDAPPHDDYTHVPDTISSAKAARSRGMVVNTIQCGDIRDTVQPWRNIAQYGGGEYFAIAQDGGVQAIATPYDAELASLGEKIGGTYLAYGHMEERSLKQAKQKKVEAHVMAAAPAPAQAERAVNKALNSSAYDESDLLQKLESDSGALAKMKDAELPDSLRELKPEERGAKVEKMLQERRALRAKILSLSKQRDSYLQEYRKKNSAAKAGGFDAAVAAALDKQIK